MAVQSDESYFHGGKMEELINKVSQRTGISADKARSAVETVIEHLKAKLPSSVSSHLDSVVSGKGGGVAERAEEILGKKSA
jgi:NAD-dependent DNA ligase